MAFLVAKDNLVSSFLASIFSSFGLHGVRASGFYFISEKTRNPCTTILDGGGVFIVSDHLVDSGVVLCWKANHGRHGSWNASLFQAVNLRSDG